MNMSNSKQRAGYKFYAADKDIFTYITVQYSANHDLHNYI